MAFAVFATPTCPRPRVGGAGHCCPQKVPANGYENSAYDPRCAKGEPPMGNSGTQGLRGARKRKLEAALGKTTWAASVAMEAQPVSNRTADAQENACLHKSPRRVYTTLLYNACATTLLYDCPQSCCTMHLTFIKVPLMISSVGPRCFSIGGHEV